MKTPVYKFAGPPTFLQSPSCSILDWYNEKVVTRYELGGTNEEGKAMHKVHINGPVAPYNAGFREALVDDNETSKSSNTGAFIHLSALTPEMRRATRTNKNCNSAPAVCTPKKHDPRQNSAANIEVIRPASGGLLTLCILTGLGFSSAAVGMAWFNGLAMLPVLAAYFAVAGTCILGAAFIFAACFTETYDID